MVDLLVAVMPSYAFITDLTVEICFTSVSNYSSAVLRFRICSETMKFDALRRHTVLQTVASQGSKYVGRQKMKKKNRVPQAEFEPAIPML